MPLKNTDHALLCVCAVQGFFFRNSNNSFVVVVVFPFSPAMDKSPAAIMTAITKAAKYQQFKRKGSGWRT